MGQSAFDEAIRAIPTGSVDTYDIHLPRSWTVHGGPVNGGVTLAAAANALSVRLGETHGHPDPLCVSAFYLTAAEAGPGQVVTEVIRASRSLSTGQARVVQIDERGAEVERLRATATFVDLTTTHAEVLTVARPPYLPPREECFSPESMGGDSPLVVSEVMSRYDMLIDPTTAGWFGGQPSGLGQIRTWFRMRDGGEPTPLMLLQVVDALPPVAYDLGLTGWVPTLELTVHVRAKPAPGWLRLNMASVNLAGGFVEEDAEIWDSSDRLVAQARQLAKVPFTPAPPPGYGWVV